MRRGITETSVVVLNPLPAVEDAEVLEKAGLAETATVQADLKPLHIDWDYVGEAGNAGTREHIRLMPGETQVLRSSDAAAFLKEKAEEGLTSYGIGADEETIRLAKIAGIKRAIVFHTDRGHKRLLEIRKRFGLTKDEMDERRSDHWSFYYHGALAELLMAHLNEVNPNAALQKRNAAKKAAAQAAA